MRFQKWISASLLFFTSLFLFCSTAFAHMILITATSPFPIQLNTSSVTNATFTVTNIASQIPITVIDQSQFPAGLSIKNTTCGSLIAPHQSCIITLQLQAPAQPVLISTELREKASPSADGVQFPIIINVVAATVPQLTVTPIAGTNGTISPSSKQLVNKGGNLTFSATPNAGYKINQWLLDGSAVQTGGANYTLSNITVSHTVQATFAVNQYTVTPSAGSNGTISPNTPQTVVNQGALTFNATPTTGYSVNQWLVDGTVAQSGGTSFTLSNITANHSLQVTFAVNQYTVTPSAGSNGSISPNTPQTVVNQGALTFNATPTTGYSVNQWLVDGTVAQSGGTSFTLSNITANHSLQVTFAINQYTVTPGAGSNGTISPNTPQTVVYQGALTFNATPATNYTVNQWLVDGTVAQTRGASFTLNNITANHTVQVTFSLATAVLTAVGQDYTGALAALVAVSNDGAGNTWSTKTITGLPNNSAFVSASCTGSDATAICAAAGYTNASGTIFPLLVVSTDGGNTWAIKTITGFTTQGNLQGVNCIGTGSTAICVATGEESLVGGGDGPAIIAVSVDGGNTWNTKPVTGLSSAGFFQPVSCTGTGSTAICVAAGEDVTGTYPPQIAVSTDGGNTWAIKTLDGITTIGQFYSVSCTGTGITAICAAVGADNGGSSQPPILTVSTDGGNTWVAQTIQGTTVNGYLMGVSCTGTGITTICAAAGGTTDTQEPLIAASTDGGNTWTKQVATNLPSTGDFSMVSCTGTGNNAICTAAGQRLDNYGPLIVSSTDGANTWTTNSIPGLTTTGQFNSASCTGSGASAICTAAGHQDFSSSSPPILVISTDGANTWAIKNIPDLPATGNFGSTGATGGN